MEDTKRSLPAWQPPRVVKYVPSVRLSELRKFSDEKRKTEEELRRTAAELRELKEAVAAQDAAQAAAQAAASPASAEPAGGDAEASGETAGSGASAAGAKTFAEAIAKAEGKKPVCLFGHLWFEGEVACLFADSNVGKSILAVQIGQEVARSMRKVLYYDFEMQDEMVGQRYMSEKGHPFDFDPYLLRPHVDYRQLLGAKTAQNAFLRIKADVERNRARVVIIDNLTALCPQSETGLDATLFLFGLKDLADDSGVSVLLLAHTPKRDMGLPLTQNDLGGSKRLFNFFDSVFALGFVPGSKDMRYLKQLKCRLGPVVFDEDHVMLMTLYKDKETGFLGFRSNGTGREQDVLKGNQAVAASPRRAVGNTLDKIVLNLKGQGVKYEVIAGVCGISLGKVANIVKSATVEAEKTA